MYAYENVRSFTVQTVKKYSSLKNINMCPFVHNYYSFNPFKPKYILGVPKVFAGSRILEDCGNCLIINGFKCFSSELCVDRYYSAARRGGLTSILWERSGGIVYF